MKPHQPNGSVPEQRRAIILAGGQSRRFGSPKALALLGGKPMLQHVIDNLEAADFEIVLSGPQSLGSQFERPCISDLYPQQGPLAALHHLFHILRNERYLVIACDTPYCTPELLTALWKNSWNYDIFLPYHAERPAPLPGVYARSCRDHIAQQLRQGRRDLRSLLETTLRSHIMCQACTEQADPLGGANWNINTREDLQSFSHQETLIKP